MARHDHQRQLVVFGIEFEQEQTGANQNRIDRVDGDIGRVMIVSQGHLNDKRHVYGLKSV